MSAVNCRGPGRPEPGKVYDIGPGEFFKTQDDKTKFCQLAEKIQAGISERSAEKVDAAMSRARLAAFNAYAQELKPACGITFDSVIGDALSSAEKELRSKAIEFAERLEMNSMLKRLSAENGGA